MAALATVVAMLYAALPIARSFAAKPDDQKSGEITMRVVQVQTKDDVADAGAIFTPPKNVAKPIAVIWVHGATVNFYSPTYLAISRGLAKRGYTVITGNTRMHDLGNVEAWRGRKTNPRRHVLGNPQRTGTRHSSMDRLCTGAWV